MKNTINLHILTKFTERFSRPKTQQNFGKFQSILSFSPQFPCKKSTLAVVCLCVLQDQFIVQGFPIKSKKVKQSQQTKRLHQHHNFSQAKYQAGRRERECGEKSRPAIVLIQWGQPAVQQHYQYYQNGKNTNKNYRVKLLKCQHRVSSFSWILLIVTKFS